MENPSWSYSSLKTFEQCPKKYYHLRVAKDVPDPPGPEAEYGTQLHRAAELYVRDGTPLEPAFHFLKPALDRLIALPGEKYCEYRMALDANLQPCDWRAREAWWRGVADLLIIEGETARCVDYKSGKNLKYADKGQLELMALGIFKHFPQVKVVRAGLLFVLAPAFIKDTYPAAKASELWRKWLAAHLQLRRAASAKVWNPRPSGLCRKHCPVLCCPHNGRAE